MRTRHRVAAAFSFALLGCDPQGAPPDAPSDGSTISDVGTEDASHREDAPAGSVAGLTFAPCSRVAGDPRDLECASISVPRDWDSPDGESFELRIERLPARRETRSQVWLLAGGPGGTTADSYGLARRLGEGLPNTEFLLIDHRGTGFNERLACPDQEALGTDGGTQITGAEIPACIAWLSAHYTPDELAFYATDQAARDVGAAIEHARRPDVAVFVYGISYGTHWAHRWLTHFPDQADGVVLDSICSPGRCTSPIGQALTTEEVGLAMMSDCADDPYCAERLGPDPLGRMREVLAQLDRGEGCPHVEAAGLTADDLRYFAGRMLLRPETRAAGPALFYRAYRCGEEDAAAFRVVFDLLNAPVRPVGAPSRPVFSVPLYLVVVAAELSRDVELTEEQVDALYANAVFASRRIAAFESVPTYPAPATLLDFAESDVPLLMMNGTMDPQTGLRDAAPIAQHFTGLHQTYVEVERAAHGAVPRSSCGASLVWQFVTAPTSTLDTTCRSWLGAVDFRGRSAPVELAPLFDPSTSTARARSEREELERMLHTPTLPFGSYTGSR